MKLILNDELVKIYKTDKTYQVYIKLSGQDGWIQHNPFPGDLRGKIAAMSLATDCMAGKFFPEVVASLPEERIAIDHKPMSITQKKRSN